VKRDITNIAQMDANPLQVLLPFGKIDGKLKVKAPTAMSAVALIR
jgi:hypothetical protein